jgi:hypothetical protein
MLPALATLADFEARLKPRVLSTDEETRASAALDDASAIVREESRRDWVDDNGQPDAPDILVRIVLKAALRDFNNPNSLASETESEGPYSRSVTYAAGTTNVALTAEDLEIVRRYRPRDKRPLWTLSTTRGREDLRTIYATDQYGVPIPLYSEDDFGYGPC